MTILAYANTTAVMAGETLSLHIALAQHATTRIVDLQVICENVRADSPIHHMQVSAAPHTADHEKPWCGFNWPVSYELHTTTEWHSGLYSLRDIHGSPLLMFTVRPPTPRSRFLIQASFMTPNAYCNSGGKSFYNYNSVNGVAHVIGFQRPGLFAWYEMKLAHWLLKNAIEADWCSSLDVHRIPDLLNHYDVLLIGGHDEYWTATMRGQFEKFVAEGGRLVVLSGNTGHRQVRVSSDCTRMTYYGRADLDPELHSSELAIDVADTPLDNAINQLLGAGWEYGAYGIDEEPAAYHAHFLSHWVFDDVCRSDQLHRQCSSAFMHYETDAAHWRHHSHGHPRATGIDGTAQNAVILASADLNHWRGKPGSASMVLSCFGSGWVFHGGTTEWIDALTAGDPQIERITQNVLHKFLQRDALVWNAIDNFSAATRPTYLCTHAGHLFWVDSHRRLWQRDTIAASVTAQCIEAVLPPDIKDVRGLAGNADSLCLMDGDGTLWLHSVECSWQRITIITDKMQCTTAGIALCGDTLYAIDEHGCLLRSQLKSQKNNLGWMPLSVQPLHGEVRALTSRSLHLLAMVATTSSCQLWRTEGRFIEESQHWVCIAELPKNAQTIALAHDLLFLTTLDGALRIMPSAAVTGRTQRTSERSDASDVDS